MSEETILGITVPPEMPRAGNRFTRWLGRTLFSLSGWKMAGDFPKAKKVVFVGAPHTSNWDFILSMLALMAFGIRASYLMKQEAFFWPFKSLFIWLGGIPLNRSKNTNMVEQTTRWFAQQDKAWIGITPEGTRDKVKDFKTGFVRIAKAANVPIGFVSWHYPTKTIHLETCWELTGNEVADAKAIQIYLTEKYQGRHPNKQ